MKRLRRNSPAVLALVASGAVSFGAAVSCPSTAWAHGPGGTHRPVTMAQLPDGPIKRGIVRLQQQRKRAGIDTAVVAEPVRRAMRAVSRARGARDAGDQAHAKMLDKLAEEWLAVARAMLRAAKAEARSGDQAKRAREFTSRLERARALLTEQQARRGRLQAEVRKLESKAAKRSDRSAKVEDAGPKRNPKPRKPKKRAPAKPPRKGGAVPAGGKR
jgi:hypothetical protein